MDDALLILDLADKHAWPALSAVAIGLLVRALKSPKVPPPLDRIPARARPLVALLLGIASGALEAVVAGTPWQKAVIGGVIAAAVAIASHQLVIEGARGGRELGEPKPPPDLSDLFAESRAKGARPAGVVVEPVPPPVVVTRGFGVPRPLPMPERERDTVPPDTQRTGYKPIDRGEP